MIRRPPRSTQGVSSAASDVYKRQKQGFPHIIHAWSAVSYTHLRAHETSLHLVCRLLLEKKKKNNVSTDLEHKHYRQKHAVYVDLKRNDAIINDKNQTHGYA
eukprot:TRINITY_DN22542_c0_g1_i1.p1 TRINITY_DN22542_c0_g1~~TRINITY_DN22542_c0_g1_i1.p1  ORF type:complete len:102 (-),score=21.50 TRINITY_DN22542_c0_g1_i1:17-322(-)